MSVLGYLTVVFGSDEKYFCLGLLWISETKKAPNGSLFCLVFFQFLPIKHRGIGVVFV